MMRGAFERDVEARQMETSEGWIGTWSPGIGDPSWVGWFTVVLYFAVAVATLRLLRRHSFARHERWFWTVLALMLLGLGVNKQLDLQTAFTELGRIVAREQGWYEVRHRVQLWFMVGVAFISVGGAAAAVVVLRRVPPATKVSLVGVACLLSFVVVRASSFHHVDHFLGARALGLRWNWLLEIGGLLVISLGVRLRPDAREDSALVVRERVGRGAR